jgi:hypothetical protein
MNDDTLTGTFVAFGLGMMTILLVTMGLLFVLGYNQGVANYDAPLQNITISHTYPREDAYLNHYPPYVLTSDSKIFYVTSDRDWARLETGSTCRVGIDPKTRCTGRECDGIVTRVESCSVIGK